MTQRNITHKREFSTHAALVSYEKFSKEMNRSWDWRFWRKRSRRHGPRFRIRNYWKTFFLCQGIRAKGIISIDKVANI